MTESHQLTLHRRRVQFDASAGLHGLLEALLPLMTMAEDDGSTGPFSVVNIGVESEPLRLFCTANVNVALTAQTGTLAVELAPTRQYVRFALQGVVLTLSVATAVGALLRTEPVVSCVSQVTELRHRLDLMALVADGYGLQMGDTSLSEAAQRMGRAIRTLLECAERADNSGCLDSLRYELMPALDSVARVLSVAAQPS